MSAPTISHSTSPSSPEGYAEGRQRQCIEACFACAQLCTEMLPHCLFKGAEHSDRDHILRLANCAQLAQVVAQFLLTGSPHRAPVALACAEVAWSCALSCNLLADDPQLTRCGESCRACAELCKSVAVPGS